MEMTRLWNANYFQNGTAITLTNADSNSTIAAGAAMTGIGFNTNYSGTNAVPTAFYLNGPPCNGPGGANLTPPASPTNLTATAVSSSQVNLTWTASTTAGVTYNVYASTSSGVTASPALRVASGLTATNFQQQGAIASTAYYYVITAVNGSSESAVSNQADATTGGASCQVSYENQSDWGTGFTGNISIINTSSSAIQGWTLTWQWPGNQQISGDWNATAAQSDNNVTLTGLDSNSTIAPGATISGIGFNANYSGANTPPMIFYVNGVQCQ